MASRGLPLLFGTVCLLLMIVLSDAKYLKTLKSQIQITSKSVKQLLNLIIQIDNKLKTTACPQNYNLYDKDNGGRFCYRYVANFCRNKTAAQEYCKSQGGNLVSFDDNNFDFFRQRAAEERALSDLQIGIPNPNLQTCVHFWTSAGDYGRETMFRFINRYKIDQNSTMWAETVEFNTGKNCAVMNGYKKYLLTDFNCALELASPLCQIFLYY